MAKVRKGSQACCGNSLLLRLVVAWVSLLMLAVCYVDFYILPSNESGDASLEAQRAPQAEAEAEAQASLPAAPVSPAQEDVPRKLFDPEALRPRDKAPLSQTSGSRNLPALQDNSPQPPMRALDSEQDAGPGPEVLPGVLPNRLHGKIGLGPDGQPKVKPTPLPPGGLSKQDKWEAHMGQCYNARKSDSLPMDRDQPDARPAVCKSRHKNYPKDLPTASVVMVFHNEIASALLRSVHSVLNQSPPHLLREVILVDDNSVPAEGRFNQERWQHLQEELSEYAKLLPKVRVVRLGERRGLMLARMEGAWRARAEVVVFLDSHIEASPGWLEPLLARIQEDRRHVVVPNILGIGFDDFSYEGASGLGVLSFSWTLGQRPQPISGDETSFRKSPIMAGGLFAADKAFFMHLGGYDPDMKFYGGEEMEIGFRTWQCGGDIEFVPCSRVYHIFRNSAFWHGTDSAGVAYKVPGHEITRNKLRAAAVWMDEFEPLVQYASPPLPQDVTLGDLEPRKELRRKLQCKPFKWYLENVAKDVFVPKIDGMKAGALRNQFIEACFDTLGSDRPGLYPCHGQHGTQGLVIDGTGAIRIPLAMYEKCLASSDHGENVKLSRCDETDPKGRMHWDLDPTALKPSLRGSGGLLRRRGSDTCLETSSKPGDKIPYSLRLAPCVEGKAEQIWLWQAW